MADVYVHCRSEIGGGGDPLANVYVSIHLPSTFAAITGGLTDADGIVFLGDQAVDEYEIHLTPPSGATISDGNLQTVEVVDTDPHVFDVVINDTALAVASDEHLCRCSGYFIDPYGLPVQELTIRFSEAETALPNLIYYAGNSRSHLLIPRVRIVKTDSDGFASVDLLREKFYSVYMEGYENIVREIQVPDAASAHLPDVIFPVVDGIEYTVVDVPGEVVGAVLTYNTPTVALSVGQSAELTLKTTYRSNLKLDGVLDVLLSNSDNEVISMSVSGSTLVVKGLAAGTAEVEVARVEPGTGSGITISPEPTIRGALGVTVSN